MQSSLLDPNAHYIRLSVDPIITSELSFRKSISDALTETFGLSSTSIYLDVLWVKEDGKECIVRTHKSDATKIFAAVASWTESPRMNVKSESPFLPSLLREDLAF